MYIVHCTLRDAKLHIRDVVLHLKTNENEIGKC